MIFCVQCEHIYGNLIDLSTYMLLAQQCLVENGPLLIHPVEWTKPSKCGVCQKFDKGGSYICTKKDDAKKGHSSLIAFMTITSFSCSVKS